MDLKSESFLEISSTLLIIFLLTVFSSLPILSILGTGLFMFFAFRFYHNIGKAIEIRDIMALIAIMQWIIGPILTYTFYPDNKFYYMSVEQEIYMRFTFWATFGFVFGLYLPFWKSKMSAEFIITQVKATISQHPFLDILLIIAGMFFYLIEKVSPGGLKFFFVLLGGMRFIGLYFLLVGNRKNKIIWLALVLGWLLISAISQGMFHDLILWISFLIMITALIVQYTQRQKALIFITFIFSILIIQTIKHEFRSESSTVTDTGSKATIFLKLTRDKLTNPENILSDNYLDASINRLNQGWIVSRIMAWTPNFEPFADGETIWRGLESALLPRFLAPDKEIAGGRTYFKRFTGRNINASTSMGLSPLGEAYANFGINGGILFMLLLGLFYNYYLYQVFRLTEFYPTLIIWIPLLFLQVIKAETDFAVVINHLSKASITVWIIFFGFRKFLGIKL
ncbi:MAG TPA: hypothetical protein DCQ31_12460 [Bacteroidales bacterium]|nr:hypothetical protein [Bacteroidales bacterium]